MYVYDEDGVMYDYRARWYLPEAGVFGERDPVGHRYSPNLTQFVRYQGVNVIDPFGWGAVVPQEPSPPILFPFRDKEQESENIEPTSPDIPIIRPLPDHGVDWTCKYAGISSFAGPGIVALWVTCKSECRDGGVEVGDYWIKAVGAGIGLFVSMKEASSYNLEDDRYSPDPLALVGVFDIVSASASWDVGIGMYWVRQGEGWGKWPAAIGDTWGGKGFGVYIARGSSRLMGQRKERCANHVEQLSMEPR